MRIPLVLLPLKLRQQRLLPPEEVPVYRQCYNGALNGVFPAEQAGNGRWSVDEGHLPLIAEAFSHAAISRTTEVSPPAPVRRLKRDDRSAKLANRAA